jgi:transcriptional regulator with XRE-family HTH domain
MTFIARAIRVVIGVPHFRICNDRESYPRSSAPTAIFTALDLDLTILRCYFDLAMRDVPQMKRLREARGWSQRDLAAKSSVTQNTISQLERGERKAMPSTVRKLAGALQVEPSVLMDESRIDAYMPREQKAVSRAPSEDRVSQRDRSLQYESLMGLLGVLDEFLPKRQQEELQGLLERKIAADERLPERQKDEVQGLLESTAAKRQAEREFFGQAEPGERHETREWAEEQWAEEHIASRRSRFEGRFALQYNVVPSLVTYPEDLNVARSRLESGDSKETIEAAQLILRRAKRIVEEYDGKLQSFRRIPEHYYADPAAQSRIRKLQKVLSERREEAAEAVQELMDLYDEILDALEDQILGMRKESDVLEAFVTQAHDWER